MNKLFLSLMLLPSLLWAAQNPYERNRFTTNTDPNVVSVAANTLAGTNKWAGTNILSAQAITDLEARFGGGGAMDYGVTNTLLTSSNTWTGPNIFGGSTNRAYGYWEFYGNVNFLGGYAWNFDTAYATNLWVDNLTGPVWNDIYSAAADMTTALLTNGVDASGLTNLNASTAFGSGTVPDARLSTNVQILFTNWANVLAYGAVADGTTDSSIAFSNAFLSGLPVWVPKGTNSYSVKSLNLATLTGSNVVWCGNGAKILPVVGSSWTIFETRNATNVIIDGLHFRAPARANLECIGLEGMPGYYARVSNCRFDTVLKGVVIESYRSALGPQNTAHPIISECVFTNCQSGIYATNTSGEYYVVNNCHFLACQWGANLEAGNFTMNNCLALNCTVGANVWGSANNSHGNIVGCILNHCNSRGVKQEKHGAASMSSCGSHVAIGHTFTIWHSR